MMRKRLTFGALAVLTVLAAPAGAQSVPSAGEDSSIKLCSFACTPDRGSRRLTSWAETTTLLVASPVRFARAYDIYYVDGRQNFIATSRTAAQPNGLDEIHVCRTLESAGVRVPAAGLVYLAFTPGVYVWKKTLWGRFSRAVDEPSEGRVRGIAEAECRVVPSEVLANFDLNPDIEADSPRSAEPVLVNGTEPRPGQIRRQRRPLPLPVLDAIGIQ